MTDQSPPNGAQGTPRITVSPDLARVLAGLSKENIDELASLGMARATPPPPTAPATIETASSSPVEITPPSIGPSAAQVILAPPAPAIVAPPKPEIVVAAEVVTPAPAPAPVVAPPPVVAPAWEPKKDEHALMPHMALLRPQFFFWSLEAIEASGYDYEFEEGKFERRYWPLEGLLLGRKEEGSSALMVLTYRKIIASNYGGKLKEVPSGSRVIFNTNQHTCELFRVLKDAAAHGGKPHIWIRPKRWETLCDGSREMCFDLAVEPDPKNKAGYKIISDESAIGQATSGEQVAA